MTNNISEDVKTLYFLFFKISQELKRILQKPGTIFKLYFVLFIYKKSDAFDDVYLT